MLQRSVALCALVMALLMSGSVPAAFAQSGPSLITETRLPSSDDIKYPHIDTLDSTVYVAGNAERSVARLWSKADSAASFAAPRTLGSAEGKPDNTSAAIFTAPDGTLYYAWTNQTEKRIYLRSRAPGAADFGPTRLVTGASPDPVEVEVAANEDGIFVFWREPDLPLRYRRSADGVNWAVPTQSATDVAIEPLLDVAAGSGRRLAVAYYRGRGDHLQSYLAIWNGSGFVNERIPAVEDRDFANPSVALLPDGSFAIAMRSTEKDSGFGAGVYVAERSPTGVWSGVARLVRGETLSVGIDADPLGNIHLFWISRASGGADLWYTFRRSGQAYGGNPLVVDTGDLPIFNVRAAASLSDRSYGHAASERFQGAVVFGQYFLFGAGVNLVGASGITLANGQEITNSPAVSVTFSGVQGNPTQVRWRWGAPPTDTQSDSGGFQPFTNPLSVATPPLADPNACTSATLYTQLRAGSANQAGTNSDSIILDRAVQSSFSVTDPNPGFDPAYTNQPVATVRVNNALECAGLAAGVVSGQIAGGSVVLDVAGKSFVETNVDLTGGPGAYELTFSATDQLGNGGSGTGTIIYDPTPPVLGDAGTVITPQPDPDGTTIVDLTLEGVTVSDNEGLYGIIVQPNVTPTAGGAPIAGIPFVVPFSEFNVLETNPDTGQLTARVSVNLADGLPPASLVPGTYDLVITFVDRAGNQSLANTVRTLTISEVTYPLHLPIIRQ
ncbi:MAG: sialidase family protein [Chloroflexi bacterium OHK40]